MGRYTPGLQELTLAQPDSKALAVAAWTLSLALGSAGVCILIDCDGDNQKPVTFLLY